MGEDLHVVMLPWSAFGHMMPFLQLSMALAKAGVHVSFISTPKNIQRLPKIPPGLAPFIDLIEFPLQTSPEIELLLEGGEATVDLPFEKIQYLKIAIDQMQNPIRQFIAKKKPDWILVDFFPHWVVDIAEEFQVKLMLFSVFTAAAIGFFGSGNQLLTGWSSIESLTVPPEWFGFPSLVAYKEFEAITTYTGLFTENCSGISDVARLAKILNSSQLQAVAIRSCNEFEGNYLNMYERLIGKPVIPVGLLPPEIRERREITDGSWRRIFEWLDKQNPKSVVFVGFGSECKLNKDQVYEIAYGLELSGLPFIWALRKPSWAIDEQGCLPIGFVDRISQKGIVCIGWAPQVEILAHSSIGGSLFHSGWGSVIETLQFGHCLVVLPFIIDQPLNARLLVEKGLAVEVKRSEDGTFSADDIAKSLRQAMVSEEGQQLRIRASEAAAVFGDKKLHQVDYITAFTQFLNKEVAKPS
ncbi:UDP-glycosyltransferase [Quillaja saponaria]|uniref:UDP-glycosyltransferase n=1 Tax=Quillaja saponaria TaxID=32244 RepID=A0AAD7LQB2_QUISA|nr:UDP-glycosyltransferase [Quillaja saponaria]